MNEDQDRYLTDLRVRHEAELEALRYVLAGRRPGILGEIKHLHAAVERETARILAAIGRGSLAPARDPRYPGHAWEVNDEKD